MSLATISRNLLPYVSLGTFRFPEKAWYYSLKTSKDQEGSLELQKASYRSIQAVLTNITNAFLCMAVAPALLARDFELTTEELISQHLRSIGPVEVTKGAPFRVATGVCTGLGRVFSQAGEESGSFLGEAGFVTGPDCLQFSVQFQSEHYPIEGFIFDGEEIRLMGFEAPRISGLSETEYRVGQLTRYVPSWEEYIKQGLFGGVLNTLWPFLRPEEVSDRLRSLKQRKVDGKELLVLKYHVSGSRGAEMFFDPETFRHVATRFRLEMRRAGAASISDRRQRVTLREKFSDFSEVDGMQLPTRWTITLELPQDTSHWEIAFHNLRHAKGPELKYSAR